MKKDKPLLSICIPTYNRKEYLKNLLLQLKELLKNNELDIEVCISDNNSNDGTWEFISKIASESSKIKIERQKENIGGNQNQIGVTALASGNWILVMGDDDILIEENFIKLCSILPSMNRYERIILNTKISEEQNLFEIKDGHLEIEELRESLIDSIAKFGFVGSHLISFEVAKIMRGIDFDDLRGWSGIGTFFHTALEKDNFFFSPPVVWQDANGQALEWQANHWLQLVLRQLQVFRINYKNGQIDSFKMKLIRSHLFSVQFLKTYYSSFLYLPKDTNQIINSYQYKQLIKDLPIYLSLLHRVIVFLPNLLPLKLHYAFIKNILRRDIDQYVYTGELDEKDGNTQDPDIFNF